MPLFLSLVILCLCRTLAGLNRRLYPRLAGFGRVLFRPRNFVAAFGIVLGTALGADSRILFHLFLGHRDGDSVLDEEVECLRPGDLLLQECKGAVPAHGLGYLLRRAARVLGEVLYLVHRLVLTDLDALRRRDRFEDQLLLDRVRSIFADALLDLVAARPGELVVLLRVDALRPDGPLE